MIVRWLEDDETYKKYRKAVKNSRLLDIDGYIKECHNLHSTRKVRSMVSGKFTPKSLIEASMQDQSYRSRMVQMRMEALRFQTLLEHTMTVMRGYLLTKHRDRIIGRTVAERSAYVDRLLSDGMLEIQRISGLMAITEEAIGDIDHAAWSLKHAFDSIQLGSKREAGL